MYFKKVVFITKLGVPRLRRGRAFRCARHTLQSLTQNQCKSTTADFKKETYFNQILIPLSLTAYHLTYNDSSACFHRFCPAKFASKL